MPLSSQNVTDENLCICFQTALRESARFCCVDYLGITSTAFVLVAALLAGGAASAESDGTVKIGGAFELVAPDGALVTEATYEGKWLLVFFGYTFCPDVCPIAMTLVSEALDALGDDASLLQPIFISVDPARDTPETLGAFVAAFDPRIVGLTGSVEQIDAVAKAYGVYFKANRNDESDPYYTVDHSSHFYLMDPQGAFVRGLSHTESGESIAAKIKEAIQRP
jgi:protein SCO1/2